ncbi:MAG: MFS transporter [Gammaproteobacteria bacterium]|nr:MFS transporter [Gammaproteobacteria bacterium]
MDGDSTSAFSSRQYRAYTWGSTLSVLGVWIQRLALGWHAWELTGSTIVVGLLATAQFLPLIVLTPFFGVIVDRISTKTAAIVMHIVLAANATALGALTVTGGMTVEWLLALAFMHGIANSAYSPVRHALIPDLVERHQFRSAVAINATIFNVSRFVGPGIAGAVVAWWGLGAAYFINAVTYLPAVFVLARLSFAAAESQEGAPASYLEQLLEGFRYTRDHAPIRKIILLAGVTNFFARGVLELMPAFAALVFDGGSGALAALMASAGVGAIVSSLLFSSPRVSAHLFELVVIGAFGVALSIVLFAFVDRLPAGMAVVGMLGLFASLVSIGSQTEVQVHVENRLRGRVMSFWTITIVGGPAAGSVLAGAIVDAVGTTATALGFAATCLVLVLTVGIRRPGV